MQYGPACIFARNKHTMITVEHSCLLPLQIVTLDIGNILNPKLILRRYCRNLSRTSRQRTLQSYQVMCSLNSYTNIQSPTVPRVQGLIVPSVLRGRGRENEPAKLVCEKTFVFLINQAFKFFRHRVVEQVA